MRILVAAVSAACLAAPVAAQTHTQLVVCGQGARSTLLDLYEGRVVVSGLTIDGRLFEVIASDEGSWVAAITEPGGLTCAPFVGFGLEVERAEPGQ